jgi:hypothetical protein
MFEAVRRESDLALSLDVHSLAGLMPGAWRDGSSMESEVVLMWTVFE